MFFVKNLYAHIVGVNTCFLIYKWWYKYAIFYTRLRKTIVSLKNLRFSRTQLFWSRFRKWASVVFRVSSSFSSTWFRIAVIHVWFLFVGIFQSKCLQRKVTNIRISTTANENLIERANGNILRTAGAHFWKRLQYFVQFKRKSGQNLRQAVYRTWVQW